MKKQNFPWLVLLTCIFTAFVFGFFAGRNLNRTPVQIRAVPATTEAIQTSATDVSTEAAIESTAEKAAENSGTTQPSSVSFPININTANSQQLEALPGIGPVIAQRIVDYRNAYGPFTSPGQLINVSGIGEKRLATIWDYITIGD